MAKQRAQAAFRFVGASLDPTEVSRHLSLKPTEAWSKGEGGKSTGYWGIDSEVQEDEPLESHLEFLLGKLEPQGKGLAALRLLGYRPELFCGLFASEGSLSVLIPARMLERIGHLGILMQLHFYDDRDDEPGT